MEKYAMSDIYWAEECVNNTKKRAEIFNKSNESKDELQFYFADEVDEELRTTKRALWLARATNAMFFANNFERIVNSRGLAHFTHYDKLVEKWEWVERKCREKAEEYK